MVKKIIRARPGGVCAGVERALKILELTVEKNKQPVYCKHEIVHNKKIVEEFQKKGVKFIEDLSLVPEGAVVVLSAHGSSPEVFQQAKQRNLTVVDAVCPLVTKVHAEARRFSEQGYQVIYIGHKNHPEAIGVLGEVKGTVTLISSLEEAKQLKPEGKGVILTQTTLSVDETKEIIDYLRSRWAQLELPAGKDICFSTQNRQAAVKALVKKAEMMVVIGSKTSSNSNRLQELGEKLGARAYLIDGPEELQADWFEGVETVGITAGASVPERLINPVIEAVQKKYGGKIEVMEVVKEEVKFKL